MIFNKTNANSKIVTKNGAGGSSSSSNNSSYSSNYSSESGDRYIWGEYDDGSNDINGNLYANGNLYVSSQGEVNYDDEDDDGEEEDRNAAYDDEDEDNAPSSSFNSGTLDEIFDTDNGNLYVEKKLRVDGDIESPEIYGKTTYIDYPELNNKKTDIKDLFKDFDGRITSNTTEINNLKTRVTQCEIDIDNLDSKIITIEGNITTINNNITEINNKIENLEGGDSGVSEERVKEIVTEMLPEQSSITILAAGVLQYTPSYMSMPDSISFAGNTNKCKINLESRKDGLLTLRVVSTESNYDNPQILCCQVIQYQSAKTSGLTQTELSKTNVGAHWFETRTNGIFDNVIYIREFHQSNNGNDGWRSKYWGSDEAVSAINILVIGKLIKKT